RPWNTEADVALAEQWDVGVPASLPNPGALALTSGVVAERAPVVPSLSSARDDLPAPYRDKCMSRGTSTEFTLCKYGDRDGDYRVILVGDTRAAQWQPALAEIARVNGWTLDVAVKTGCVLGSVVPQRDGKTFTSCEMWRAQLLEHIHSTEPDLIIAAQ